MVRLVVVDSCGRELSGLYEWMEVLPRIEWLEARGMYYRLEKP